MTTTATRTGTELRSARPVPLSRVIRVEVRKMFDTRSGFWLIASIAITGTIATVATMIFAPDDSLAYYSFAEAVGFPMTVILPIIAILSITGEWSQRTGLTTFTLVPHRGRVLTAKVVTTVAVAVGSMLFAFAIGALGNLAGAWVNDVPTTWDVSWEEAFNILLGNLIGLLLGTTIGMLIRNTPGALVTYFIYALALPPVSSALASSQSWWRDWQEELDLNFIQGNLFTGTLTSEQWVDVAIAVTLWVVVPGLIGLRAVLRSEVH